MLSRGLLFNTNHVTIADKKPIRSKLELTALASRVTRIVCLRSLDTYPKTYLFLTLLCVTGKN